jgi:hypothetical protein
VDDLSAALTVPVTLAAMAGLAVLAALCGWRGARLPDIRKGPRMIPWRWLMLMCAAFELILLIHLMALIQGG